MLLNEFLELKLGVVFEDKYNELAVQEILNHKEIYSLIYDEIDHIVNYDEKGNIKVIDYDRSYFRCDDLELVAGFKETMALYKGFVRVFWKDINHKKYKINSFAYGVDFLRMPSIETILYPYLNYSGICYIHITRDTKEFIEKTFIPQIMDDQYIGTDSIKTNNHLFYRDNRELLKNLKDNFNNISDIGNVFEARFCDEELAKHKRQIEAGITGYAYDSFEFTIGKNVIKFFATERGYDPLAVFRLPMVDSLSEEEEDLEVVKIIRQS